MCQNKDQKKTELINWAHTSEEKSLFFLKNERVSHKEGINSFLQMMEQRKINSVFTSNELHIQAPRVTANELLRTNNFEIEFWGSYQNNFSTFLKFLFCYRSIQPLPLLSRHLSRRLVLNSTYNKIGEKKTIQKLTFSCGLNVFAI